MAKSKIEHSPDRTTSSIQKGNARTAAIRAGAYDGRFATRSVPNKRALSSRNACRGKVNF